MNPRCEDFFPAEIGNRTGMKKPQLTALVLNEYELEDKAPGCVMTFLSGNICPDHISYIPLLTVIP